MRSPLCKGAEEAINELRHVAEKVSLAAARAAKACGQGGVGGGGGSKPAKRAKTEPALPPAEAPKKGGKKPKADDSSQAEKDQILMSAFSKAIGAAVQQMQAGGAP